MKTYVMMLLVVLLSVASPIMAQQRVVVTPNQNEISVAPYNDFTHAQFAGFSSDPRVKRVAIVATNHTNQTVIAAHVQWKWVDATTQKPGELLQQHNALLGVPFIGPRSSVLILPNGTASQAGQRSMYGLAIPAQLLNASNITVTMDAAIFADGRVIGPDADGLVKELEGQAEASVKVRKIMNDAQAQARDAKPELDRAIADRSLSPESRRYIADYARRPVNQIPVINLPHFHR